MITSLPMYDWPELEVETEKLWQYLRAGFAKAGIETPHKRTQGVDSIDQWRHLDLLLSQTCGYPYATKLTDYVHLVTTPHYAVAGCDGPNYSSAVLVRKDAKASTIADVKEGRFAFNSEDSLSGFRCLFPAVGNPQQYFANSTVSGGHRLSATMVANGQADIAVCDALCWHYFQAFEPAQAANLRVLSWTPMLPALPFITSKARGEGELTLIRRGVAEGIQAACNDTDLAALALSGSSFVDHSVYVSMLTKVDIKR